MSWTKTKDSRFAAFVSDIEAYMVGTRKYPRCPVCRDYLTKFIFKFPIQVGDEPEGAYKYTHKCGARLILFND